MKRNTFLIIVMALCCSAINAQTNFGWDTATVSGDLQSTTETIDGITLTTTNTGAAVGGGLGILDFVGWLGTTAEIVNTSSTSLVTFSFDQPVVVNYILPIDATGSTNVDYTFTPTPLGGPNQPITVSMVDGSSPDTWVDLNWINVTSFTVTSTAPLRMGFDDVNVYPVNAQTNFGWDTAVISGDLQSTTETIDGITLTTTNTGAAVGGGLGILDFVGWLGTTAEIVNTSTTSLVTFSFDQPVVVNYILPIDATGSTNVDYTFTPTPLGGPNQPITVSMVDGSAPDTWVDLNWINVTSFTVTSSAPLRMGFDDVNVYAFASLSVEDNIKVKKAIVYPNPVENSLSITNVSDFKSITIYNSLGQRVLQSKQKSIDMSHLSKGMYFLQIRTALGTETKRIIKK